LSFDDTVALLDSLSPGVFELESIVLRPAPTVPNTERTSRYRGALRRVLPPEDNLWPYDAVKARDVASYELDPEFGFTIRRHGFLTAVLDDSLDIHGRTIVWRLLPVVAADRLPGEERPRIEEYVSEGRGVVGASETRLGKPGRPPRFWPPAG
jgi:hypothetical protein